MTQRGLLVASCIGALVIVVSYLFLLAQLSGQEQSRQQRNGLTDTWGKLSLFFLLFSSVNEDLNFLIFGETPTNLPPSLQKPAGSGR